MNRNDLRHADINLLVIFETMMHERNVTRTGERLFLGQATISSALNRLRTMFGDPLFIRTGRMMEPTARAEEIHVLLGPALEGVALALSCTQEFDPRTSEETFHVGLCDEVEYALLPRLIQQLRTEAPSITLVVRRVDAWQLPQLLVAGDISLGVGQAHELPARAYCRNLRAVRPMLLCADSVTGPMNLDEFCRRPHVAVSAQGKITDDIDRALARHERRRRVVLAVPQLSALPALLAGSDMLAVVPDYAAQAMARVHGLRTEYPPLQLSSPDLAMAWRGTSHADPRERWLRSCFARHLGQQPEHLLSLAVA